MKDKLALLMKDKVLFVSICAGIVVIVVTSTVLTYSYISKRRDNDSKKSASQNVQSTPTETPTPSASPTQTATSTPTIVATPIPTATPITVATIKPTAKPTVKPTAVNYFLTYSNYYVSITYDSRLYKEVPLGLQSIKTGNIIYFTTIQGGAQTTVAPCAIVTTTKSGEKLIWNNNNYYVFISGDTTSCLASSSLSLSKLVVAGMHDSGTSYITMTREFESLFPSVTIK